MSEREKRIRAAMLGVGLKSIDRLAKRAGVSSDRLYRWVKGENARFSVEELRDLAAALEVSVAELLGEEPSDAA